MPPATGTGSPRAKYPDEWYLSPPHRVGELFRKASTHSDQSFDPMTEHIASEMHLILRSDKGKASVLYGVYARMQGGLTLPDVTYYSSADRSACWTSTAS